MIETDTIEFQKSCYELNEIIANLNLSEYNKIPSKIIENIKKNAVKKHDFKFDKSKNISEQSIMPLTQALLVEIYIRFLSPCKDKELWDKYNSLCLKKIDKKKQEKYNRNNLFKNKHVHEIIEDNSLIVMEKEGFFKRIYTKVMKFFKK